MSGIRFSGLASGMDTENIIKQMMEIEKMKVTKVEKEKTKMEWKKDVWKEMNTKIFDFYKKQVFDLKSAGSFMKKTVTTSDDNALSVTATTGAPRGTHSIKVDKMAKGSFLTSNNKIASNYTATERSTFTISSGGKNSTFTIAKDKQTVTDIIEQINASDLDVKASYDSKFGKIFLSTTNTGEDSTIGITGVDEDGKTLISDLGFEPTSNISTVFKGISFVPQTETIQISYGGSIKELNLAGKNVGDLAKDINNLFGEAIADGTGAVLDFGASDVKLIGESSVLTAIGFTSELHSSQIGSIGQDASFEYNGTTLTSDSNEVSVNGLDIILKQEGMTSAATINVTQDTDAIYDKVKDFVLKYNELVLDINGKVNAESARKYAPLTSEEKEAMSDEDVKLWEKKIKDSLLRRDDVLTGLASSMRGVVVSSSGVKSKVEDGVSGNYKDLTELTAEELKASQVHRYLSDLGIVTGSYTERGILHIQGDEDDSLYAAKENELKKAIEDDPEKVAEFLNAMGTELYEKMQDKMKSTTLSSALTFYNDKSMDKQVKAYESKIADLEERMAAVEARYYKQFSAMEKMIQQMNNQSSSLMGMMGGGQ